MSNTSDEHQASQQASADAWLDELVRKFMVDYWAASANDSLSQLNSNEEHFKAAIKSHLQEREAAARVDELQKAYDYGEVPEWYLKERLAELLAVGEGRG